MSSVSWEDEQSLRLSLVKREGWDEDPGPCAPEHRFGGRAASAPRCRHVLGMP